MKTAFGIFVLLIYAKELVEGCPQLGKNSFNCYGMNHRVVPQHMSSSAESINLAFNRIRELKVYSFKKYTKLKVLRLFDNAITIIEEGTFEPLSNLEEIDLSTNSLRTLPLDLFNLPSLRNLYLDNNMLSDLNKDLMRLERPISAPLEYLNVADCRLDDIPDLGILPKLGHLNASSNPLNKISLERFSYMCALDSIDLNKNEIPFCECQEIANFAGMYYRKTLDDRLNFCDNRDKIDSCPEPTLKDKMLASPEYEQCNYAVKHPPISKKTWIIIGVCLAGIIILILTLIYNCRKKRQKRKLRKKKKMATNGADKLFMYNNNGTTSQGPESDLNELTPSPA